ncbi:cellulose synthase subunit BcsC-related outer membrane protein [Aliiglaciecola sp. CAU 1673]|uniref:cellulose synthase subunit BcsC-related outer membrane protein n=1 Tax=Aliiglaciecola sp. CAU 1673 TaxID=3032595 RepID=UPI0023DA12DA|nr:cellulose synthase subunit BcsC-related outer membrane protein [Aliiglaciecola sp. CAU 1673]MDF2179655.1 cellulose synthase subunit BcsC-related outer membrane protein [Aliiglaciecola sp. CAU 1673]
MARVSLVTLLVCAACHNQALAQATYDKDQVIKNEIPTLESLTQQQVDVTGFWFYVREGKLAQARAEIHRLQQQFPNWVPNPDMLQAVNPQPLAQAEKTTKRRDLYREEMGMLAKMSAKQWKYLSDKRLSMSREGVKLRKNAKDAQLLGWISLAKGQGEIAQDLFEAARTWKPSLDIKDGMLASLTQQSQAAVEQKDIERLQQIDHQARQWGEEGIGLGGAWQWFEQGDYDAALVLFRALPESAQTTLGQALSLERLGDKEKARQLACANTHMPDLAGICVDKWRENMVNAYQADDYAGTIEVSDQLAPLDGLNSDQKVLQAWSYYHLEQTQAAAKLFNELLEQAPEDEALAQGLVNTADSNQLASAAQRFPAVQRVLHQQVAEQAFSRKQFDLAHISGHAEADWRDSLMLTLATQGEHRGGQQGLQRFDNWHSSLALSAMYQDWRWWLALDYRGFYSGLPASDAPFGSRPEEDSVSPISQVQEPGWSAGFRREWRDWLLKGRLLSDDSLQTGSRLYGDIALQWFNQDWTHRINLFAEPINESLLSRTGALDPVDGMAWGAVEQRGAEVLNVYSFQPWAVAMTLRHANLSGTDVVDNSTQFIRLDLNHDLTDSDALDYWRLGPFISYQQFDHNLSGFTRQQGGYFSPEQDWRLGLYSELLTAEAQTWQVRASTSLAYGKSREQAEFANQVLVENSGINADLRVEGQWLLTSRVQVEGYLSRSTATGYQGTRGGIWIRLFWQPRQHVLSQELPLSF